MWIQSAVVSLNSSQMGAVSGGFDSPTISTAKTNSGGITHLGVVGRGVKRASLNLIDAEPSLKKLSLEDSSSERANSSLPKLILLFKMLKPQKNDVLQIMLFWMLHMT